MTYTRSIVSFALLAGFGIGSAAAQSAAPAQSPPPPSNATSNMMPAQQQAMPESESGAAPAFADLSKDGKAIQRKDVPKDNPALNGLRAHFGESDTNHDGKLDKGEYDAYVSKASQRPQSSQ